MGGFTKVDNDIFDVLLTCRLSGQEFQLALTVFRQTFGWHKEAICIDAACFMDITGICRQNVHRGLRSLLKRKIICRNIATDGKIEWSIQLDTSKWVCRKNATRRKNATNGVAKTRQSGNHPILVKEKEERKTPIVPFGSSAKKKPVSRDPPPGVDSDVWNGYLEMRKAKKAPWTARARTIAINTLRKLQDEGENPEHVVDQSTFRGWTGFFQVKKGFEDRRVEIEEKRRQDAKGRFLGKP